MKVTVSNLGVIKKAEVDLKPLTIFVGENNTGKTWTAYALAGALGIYGWRQYITAYVTGKKTKKYPKLDEIVKQVAASGEGVLDIVEFAEKEGEKCINDMLQLSNTWMRKFLSTDRVKFDALAIRADIKDVKPQLLKKLQEISITDTLGQQNPETAVLRALKEPGESKLFFYPGLNISNRLPQRAIKEFVVSIVFRELLRFFYSNIRTFPTERTSIIDSTFLPLSINELSDETEDATKEDWGKKELRRFLSLVRAQSSQIRSQGWPISSFAAMIAELYANGHISDRQEKATEDPIIQQYLQLADILQEEILSGKIDFSTPDPGPNRKEILFQPDNDPNSEPIQLEISVTSSMVKELSSLVLYLRYLAEPGELLVIDEPEMNLHPAAQVKIIEFLAMLVNAGLNVLVTTHSTYLIDHLTNLMDAYKHEKQDEIVEMFLLERKEAFIAQDKVSVYLFDNDREVKSILDPGGAINWQTFSDVTELVQRIHFEL